jgi:hypothetical protein
MRGTRAKMLFTVRARHWLFWVVMASCLLGVAGCGGGSDDSGPELGWSAPTLYWQGKPSEFCKTRIQAQETKRRAAAGLLLETKQVRPEEVLLLRVRNLGQETLEHGLGPVIYQRVGERWEPRSRFEPGESHLTPLLAVNLPPASTGGCQELPIPLTWKPGQYRVTLELELADPKGEDVLLRPWGYFQVLPRANAQ